MSIRDSCCGCVQVGAPWTHLLHMPRYRDDIFVHQAASNNLQAHR
jgi:hypothetical protein